MTKWRKSSFSLTNGDCVEVAGLPGSHVGVRHSKDTEGPALPFTPDEWQAFLGGVRSGKFDKFLRSRFAAHERPPPGAACGVAFGL